MGPAVERGVFSCAPPCGPQAHVFAISTLRDLAWLPSVGMSATGFPCSTDFIETATDAPPSRCQIMKNVRFRDLTPMAREQGEGGAVDHASCYWRLGQVCQKAGRKAEAIAAMEKALRLRPDFEDAKKSLKELKG